MTKIADEMKQDLIDRHMEAKRKVESFFVRCSPQSRVMAYSIFDYGCFLMTKLFTKEQLTDVFNKVVDNYLDEDEDDQTDEIDKNEEDFLNEAPVDCVCKTLSEIKQELNYLKKAVSK